MGLFDAFSSGPANAAAGAQIGAINSGLSQLIPQYQAGQTALTTNTGQANNALTANTGAANNALQTNYTAGLSPFLQNYNTAGLGVDQLKNLLGLNGASGTANALATLQATPGYQFQLQQGEDAVKANQAATGQLDSGNTDIALDKFGQGLAGTTYNNYVNQLMPFLNASQNAASGIGSLYSNLGSNLSSNYGRLGSGLSSNYTGLGTGLNQSDQNIGNAIYGANASIGNAQANADLANYNASANGLNAIMGGLGGLAKLGVPGGGTVGGNFLSGLGSFLTSDIRAKDDIEPVGELFDGQTIFRYRYKGDPAHQLGLIAQEVEETIPEAVAEFGGVKHVNYRTATDFAADLGRFMKEAA